MYRYLNLTHWLVYSEFVFGRGDLDMDELLDSGLLLESEKKSFEVESGGWRENGLGSRGDPHNVVRYSSTDMARYTTSRQVRFALLQICAWMSQEYRAKFPRDPVTGVSMCTTPCVYIVQTQTHLSHLVPANCTVKHSTYHIHTGIENISPMDTRSRLCVVCRGRVETIGSAVKDWWRFARSQSI